MIDLTTEIYNSWYTFIILINGAPVNPDRSAFGNLSERCRNKNAECLYLQDEKWIFERNRKSSNAVTTALNQKLCDAVKGTVRRKARRVVRCKPGFVQNSQSWLYRLIDRFENSCLVISEPPVNDPRTSPFYIYGLFTISLKIEVKCFLNSNRLAAWLFYHTWMIKWFVLYTVIHYVYIHYFNVLLLSCLLLLIQTCVYFITADYFIAASRVKTTVFLPAFRSRSRFKPPHLVLVPKTSCAVVGR